MTQTYTSHGNRSRPSALISLIAALLAEVENGLRHSEYSHTFWLQHDTFHSHSGHRQCIITLSARPRSMLGHSTMTAGGMCEESLFPKQQMFRRRALSMMTFKTGQRRGTFQGRIKSWLHWPLGYITVHTQ